MLWMGNLHDVPPPRTSAPDAAAKDNTAALAGNGHAVTVRDVTAYNVGAPEQTSEQPCIGAAGDNLCRLVRNGKKVCAANFVALGTVLHIGHYGDYVVLDRLNRRYPHRVDIAMAKNRVAAARRFGRKKLVVAVK